MRSMNVLKRVWTNYSNQIRYQSSGYLLEDDLLGTSKRFKLSAFDAGSLLSLEKPRVLITGALGQLGQGLARILR